MSTERLTRAKLESFITSAELIAMLASITDVDLVGDIALVDVGSIV